MPKSSFKQKSKVQEKLKDLMSKFSIDPIEKAAGKKDEYDEYLIYPKWGEEDHL